MVVKERRGRKRYILFISDKKVDIAARIVYREGNFGIARCWHREVNKTRNALEKAGARTLKTSGTIKKLKEYISKFLPGGAV
ncbi:MAG: hypothetical protein J7K61_01820 [Thermoplasmata archaeon]|nr:hypothetical protein [Thermoplasmata archaeon]